MRGLVALFLLSIGVGILAFAMTGSNAANRDFISYWAAGQQLAHRQNPYDGPAILGLERQAGFTADTRPLFMRNPPWALFLALPLGFVTAKTGAVAWSLALIASLMASIRMVWIMHSRPPGRLHLVGYLFPPGLACLLAGQVGIFILLGVALFLYFHKSRKFLAGCALFLCAMKPHLFLPFGTVLLLWAVMSGAYRILFGALVSMAAGLALSFYLDPAVWPHYFQMARASNLQNEFIPTISLMFRLIIHRSSLWLQFVPAVTGSAWALIYFWRHREIWEWSDQGLLVLVISVLVAPYAWVTDEVVLLPAILAGLYLAVETKRGILPFAVISVIALIEVLVGVVTNSGFYIWTAPAWLLWFLDCKRAAVRMRERQTEEATILS